MKFKVSNFFGRLFGASSKEVGGVIVLVTFILAGILFVKLLDRHTTTGYQGYLADSLMLDSLLATMDDGRIEQPAQPAVVYIAFDPNLASLEELISLGLDSAIAKRIIKYRDKGGVYRQKSDLKKIYGLSETKFNELYDYIKIPVKIVSEERYTPEEVATKPTKRAILKAQAPILSKFDLNLADTSVLQTVKGVGSVLSGRIVSFRDKLGGFVEMGQLYQVYNLDSVVVSRLTAIGFITPGFVPELIPINSVGVDEIAAHPYISWNQARLLVAYRNQHGPFRVANDLAEVYSFDQELVEKIKPYMSFDG